MSSRTQCFKYIFGRRGFTVVEMMVALSLAAVATAVVFSVFVSTQGMYYDTRQMMENQSDSRVILGMMTQEIRSAGSDLMDIGVQQIALAAADTVRIQSDLNGDGVLDALSEPAEDVVFFYNSTDEALVRTTAGGPIVIMNNVKSFVLGYLAADGTVLSPLPLDATMLDRVRAITIDMDVELSDSAVRHWNSTVALRNDPRVR